MLHEDLSTSFGNLEFKAFGSSFIAGQYSYNGGNRQISIFKDDLTSVNISIQSQNNKIHEFLECAYAHALLNL